MNELEVEKQIEQMVRFIKQEAQEKANEIRVSAEEEFSLEKLQLLEQDKAKIRKDYERREGQLDVKKKIEYSKTLNDMRIQVLAAREVAIQEVVTEARAKLLQVSKNPASYQKLLLNLLVQAMRKLGEKKAIVRCRQVDLLAVRDIMEPAVQQYVAMFSEEAPSLTLDQKEFLPPAPTDLNNSEIESCCGGILLTSIDGRITCANTLDERLKIAYQANLPDIRTKLFGTQ